MVPGTFSPTEIALTVVIGIVSLGGMISCIQTTTRLTAATAVFLLSTIVQFGALVVSVLSGIEHHEII